MCTLHDFSSGKVRFIYTSTVTRSHSCYGKNYAYALRTSSYNLSFNFVFVIYNPDQNGRRGGGGKNRHSPPPMKIIKNFSMWEGGLFSSDFFCLLGTFIWVCQPSRPPYQISAVHLLANALSFVCCNAQLYMYTQLEHLPLLILPLPLPLFV